MFHLLDINIVKIKFEIKSRYYIYLLVDTLVISHHNCFTTKTVLELLPNGSCLAIK